MVALGATRRLGRGTVGPLAACGPEWDLVAESDDGLLLLGEVKWKAQPFGWRALDRACHMLDAKPVPTLPVRYAQHETLRVLLVPELAAGVMAGPGPPPGTSALFPLLPQHTARTSRTASATVVRAE